MRHAECGTLGLWWSHGLEQSDQCHWVHHLWHLQYWRNCAKGTGHGHCHEQGVSWSFLFLYFFIDMIWSSRYSILILWYRGVFWKCLLTQMLRCKSTSVHERSFPFQATSSGPCHHRWSLSPRCWWVTCWNLKDHPMSFRMSDVFQNRFLKALRYPDQSSNPEWCFCMFQWSISIPRM